MKVSIRWLKQYIDFNLSLTELVTGLTMSGLEVEEVIDLGYLSKSIVIGQIQSVDSHPNADKLSVCRVTTGGNLLNIVCGATNMKAGDRVVVALPGTMLPGGLKLKKTRIREVDSEGMMCSSEELGLPKSNEGIMILSSDAPVGEGFDAILDISITPNRPDCLSLIGVAREIRALTGNSVRLPKPRFTEKLESSSTFVDIEIKNKNGCPRYCARLLENIQVQPSPLWLQNAVILAGMRPINNIVDVTNFVLWELGHPLHAFDYNLIKGKKVIVRNARKNEKLPAIDEREYSLDTDALVIADQDKPIALAGIIGGKNTEVNDSTTSVLLEAAYFDPVSIRRTARKTGLQTEASYHFERGTDPQILPLALNRVTELIQEMTGAEVKKDIIDVSGKSYSHIPTINLHIKKVNELLGTTITLNEINDIFQKLDIEIVDSNEEDLIVRPPSYRTDIQREIDCIEEIARIYGYDKIPETYPYISPINRSRVVSEHSFFHQFKDVLAARGLREVFHYSFLSGLFQKKLGFQENSFIALANPLSQDLDTLRVSLLPCLLKNLHINRSSEHEGVNCFEVGKIFYKNDQNEECEEWSVAFILWGNKVEQWYEKQSWDFYNLKGIAESVLETLDIKKYSMERITDSYLYHPGKSFCFRKGDKILFQGGELHPRVMESIDVKGAAFYGEFFPVNMHKQQSLKLNNIQLYRYPGNHRDISMIFSSDIPYSEIKEVITKTGGPLLWKILLVDYYEDPQLGQGNKSLTFHLIYRHSEKTLSDEDITPSFEAIIKGLANKFNARLR